MKELKPCPFCGETAHILDYRDKHNGKIWQIGCITNNCIMYLPPRGTRSLDHYVFISKETSIRAWNTRAKE